MSYELIHGDARQLPIEDATVDLVVTSPPYFGLRSYQDGGRHYDGQVGAEATPTEFVDALIDCTREMVRVLKPSGSIWVNLGDKYAGGDGSPGGASKLQCGTKQRAAQGNGRKAPGRPKSLIGIPWRYAIRCIDDLGLILRAEVIWSKPNGLPESVKDRVRRSHEQWFHFTLNPRYYSAVDEVREPHTDHRVIKGTNGGGGHKTGETGLTAHTLDPSRSFHPLGKLPGSVWTIATEPLAVPEELGVDHFAAFPMEWPRRIIQGWSPEDGVVLDPFGGTGTTALCADVLGRHGISNDMSADYQRIAEWRINDPKQRAKAARTEYRPPVEVPDGQALMYFGDSA